MSNEKTKPANRSSSGDLSGGSRPRDPGRRNLVGRHSDLPASPPNTQPLEDYEVAAITQALEHLVKQKLIHVPSAEHLIGKIKRAEAVLIRHPAAKQQDRV